ncbi:TetR/AcrR family transcriptional regulator [Leucobacter chinensis]|uniref:TetR/AcrR family transcriptional regulator n=1 Tax=Leucobacter chinensis TaxID=2851010 RepID=UPI001C210DF1
MREKSEQAKGPERRVGLTPTKIVAEARELTRGRGFHSWTVRDLAAALDVAPSVIYHHIGGKQEIIRCVIEGAVAELTPPRTDVCWQEFFRGFLLEIYPILREYPGAAKWLMMHGPSFPSVRSFFDVGHTSLTRAGFERPAVVYALLVNSAVLTVMLSDERLEGGEDGPRDHGAMKRSFESIREGSIGVATMIDEMLVPFTADPDGAGKALNFEYYSLLISVMIAGLEQQLQA